MSVYVYVQPGEEISRIGELRIPCRSGGVLHHVQCYITFFVLPRHRCKEIRALCERLQRYTVELVNKDGKATTQTAHGTYEHGVTRCAHVAEHVTTYPYVRVGMYVQKQEVCSQWLPTTWCAYMNNDTYAHMYRCIGLVWGV
jgi:hypothetical protein